jgi:hypothetical protein
VFFLTSSLADAFHAKEQKLKRQVCKKRGKRRLNKINNFEASKHYTRSHTHL